MLLIEGLMLFLTLAAKICKIIATVPALSPPKCRIVVETNTSVW